MASSIFQLAYGYRLKGKDDQFFQQAREAVLHGLEAVMFTSKLDSQSSTSKVQHSVPTLRTDFYVNLFPALVYVPDWFPGAGWKRTIQEWREHKDRAISTPFEWTKAQVVRRSLIYVMSFRR
jgi:hypothetical protein